MSTLILTQENNLQSVVWTLAAGLWSLVSALCVVACVLSLVILLGAVFAFVVAHWVLLVQVAGAVILVALFALATYPKAVRNG